MGVWIHIKRYRQPRGRDVVAGGPRNGPNYIPLFSYRANLPRDPPKLTPGNGHHSHLRFRRECHHHVRALRSAGHRQVLDEVLRHNGHIVGLGARRLRRDKKLDRGLLELCHHGRGLPLPCKSHPSPCPPRGYPPSLSPQGHTFPQSCRLHSQPT